VTESETDSGSEGGVGHSPRRGGGSYRSSADSSVDTEASDEADDAMRDSIVMTIKDLYREQHLSFSQAKKLMLLLKTDNPKLMAAFDVFASVQDVDDLLDSLVRLCNVTAAEDDDEDEDDEEDEEEEEDDEEEEDEDDDDDDDEDGSVEQRFLAVASKLRLTSKQRAALMRSVQAQDVVVRAALEVFRDGQDEEDLKDTLTRVAKHHVEGSDSEAEEAEEGKEGSDDGSGGSQAEEEEEGGDDDEQTVGGVPPKFLIAKMHQDGLLTDQEADNLLALYKQHDIVVQAALDVFEIGESCS
jgi:hypothetical protein